jgi:hypothetical protein
MKISTTNNNEESIEITEQQPSTPTKITTTTFSSSVLSVKSVPSSSSSFNILTPTATRSNSSNNDMPHRNFNIDDIQIWRQIFQMEIDNKNDNNIGLNNLQKNQNNQLNKIHYDSLETQYISKSKLNDIILYATSDE